MASTAWVWDESYGDEVVQPYRVTVHQFEAMFATGLIEDDRVQLREGMIVKVAAQHMPHMRQDALDRAAHGGDGTARKYNRGRERRLSQDRAF